MVDKKKEIWAVCDEMLREGKERKEITGRKVAERKDVKWSHTTVTPYVTSWHDDRTKAEQDMLAKTQMSPHFVKALKSEVEDRVTKLREIDANQYAVMHEQLGDMVAENGLLEVEVEKLKAELEDKSSKLVAVNTELEQAKKAQEALSEELKEKTAQYEAKLEKANTDHSAALSEANAQHAQAVEKLNTRLDDKSSEVSDLNAKLALADLKASQHEQLTQDLAAANESVLSLTNENMRLNAEMTATKKTVQTLTETLSDTKAQRDKAQNASDEAVSKLEVAQQKLNDSLLEAAKLGSLAEST
ncbi:hypothetical protein [Vibrio parahaemolyticus]|uniref:hypothetical protein n=1 Tax=Vibrio parahaemolyticus TaxID=670 RepID=UPI000D52FE21|nr:hypothetical protein [Vibrio parahaemolyticus]AWG77739.1 hypothetical protein C9I78_02390 [Vibrio parahaemolyticus]AWJ77367.1 hypothetical protein C7Y67_02510 [Vibrio parahaemolyticus]